MPNVSSSYNSPAMDLGPFHGNHKSNAIVYSWLTAAQISMLFIFPWLVALLDALHHHRGHHLLSVSLWELCLLNLVGFTTAWSYWKLWKRLGAKIAEGGEGAPFLDQVRFGIASLVQGLVVLLVITLVFIVIHDK